MASPWINYNMKRVSVGLDAWLNPAELAVMSEELDKSVLASIQPRMVKLTGFDAHGRIVSHASGFLYSTEATLIVTCGHVRFYSPPPPQQPPPSEQPPQQLEVARFRARYASDGMEEDVSMVTAPHPVFDLMLLSGSRRAASNFLASSIGIGDTAYVAGFPPESTAPCFSKGMVGSSTHLSFTVDAHADNGWSGGPVVNKCGQLVGVMQQGLGSTIKRPDAISAGRLHDFVQIHNCIGLSST